jgi:hypothetical protein
MLIEIVKIWTPLILLVAAWLIFALYFGKKVETAKSQLSDVMESPPEALTLVRAINSTNYLRKFSVLIDGIRVGDINAGQTMHFPVSVGSHKVKV